MAKHGYVKAKRGLDVFSLAMALMSNAWSSFDKKKKPYSAFLLSGV